METRTIDPDQIWQRMLDDVEFVQQTPEGAPREAWRELIGQLPEALGPEILNAPLTVASFMKAKLAVARHFVTVDFPARLVGSFPDDFPMFAFIDKETVIGLARELYAVFVPAAEAILGNVPEFLAEQGITEEVFLGHPKGAGLSDEAMRAWRGETLTVAGLFLLQPLAFLDFSGKK